MELKTFREYTVIVHAPLSLQKLDFLSLDWMIAIFVR